MVFPILGANTESAAYDIDNSLRFRTPDDPRLTREFDQDPTGNRKTFTISCWVKRSGLGANQTVLSASTTSNFNDKVIGFRSAYDQLEVANVASGSDAINIITNRFFRDVAAWYHIVVAIDTTQSSLADGVKFYVNGVRDTDFDGTPVYNQNATFEIGRSGSTTAVGMLQQNSSQFLDAYLSEFFFIDGQQLDPTYFGETNNNGVWIPKDYDGTYGNNGFRLEFKQTGTSQNSSGMGADTSGNDQHFAVTNIDARDICVDTPTNNFATLNPLSPTQGSPVYTEGNLKIAISSTAYSYFPSTFGLSNGKWYVEVRINQQGGNTFIGIAETSMEAYYTGANNDPHLTSGTIWYGHNGNGNYDGASQDASTFGAASYTNSDIIGLALDLDSGTKTIKFYKNGSLTVTKNLTSNFVDPIVFAANLYNTQNQSWNFGNPTFSISSGNADANGYGNFEYAPPSGYYAVCTKNLAEFG